MLYHKKHLCLTYAGYMSVLCRGKIELRDVVKTEEQNIWTGLIQFEKWRWFKIVLEEYKSYTFSEIGNYELWTTISRKPGFHGKMRAKLMVRIKCLYSLKRVFGSKLRSRKLKIRIYKTIARPFKTLCMWNLHPQTDRYKKNWRVGKNFWENFLELSKWKRSGKLEWTKKCIKKQV